jgi:hypothetical protein
MSWISSVMLGGFAIYLSGAATDAFGLTANADRKPTTRRQRHDQLRARVEKRPPPSQEQYAAAVGYLRLWRRKTIAPGVRL